MLRYISIAASNYGDVFAYDPCAGLTYLFDSQIEQFGRVKMDESELNRKIVIHPKKLNLDYPISICWSPIVSCNLNCPHCLDDKKLKTLNRPEQVRIADIIKQSKILGIDISGGEPLLISDLPYLITRLKEDSNKVVSVTTNGWYLKKRINEIHDLIDALRISLDGPNSKVHNKLRGAESFEKAIEGLRFTKKFNIPIQVQNVLMKSNQNYLNDLFKLAIDEGVNGVTLLQMLPIGTGGSVFSVDEMLTDEEVVNMIKNVEIPEGLNVRIRLRKDAEQFTVIRANGTIYRNGESATSIIPMKNLNHYTDLNLKNSQDGSA